MPRAAATIARAASRALGSQVIAAAKENTESDMLSTEGHSNVDAGLPEENEKNHEEHEGEDDQEWEAVESVRTPRPSRKAVRHTEAGPVDYLAEHSALSSFKVTGLEEAKAAGDAFALPKEAASKWTMARG